MNSLAEENYLKALYHLSQEGGEVTVNELSKNLHIKMPTVTSMMKKLAGKKLVYYESYQPLKLTKKGFKEAGLIIRKHRLTEMFLSDKMRFGWEQVHEIAEQIEHIQAPIFFDRMDAMLGYPKVDPHGSPIPDKNGNIIFDSLIKLSECATGDSVVLAAVINTSSEFLSYLTKRKLKLGVKMKVKAIETFDKSVTIIHGNKYTEVISAVVAERLLIKK